MPETIQSTGTTPACAESGSPIATDPAGTDAAPASPLSHRRRESESWRYQRDDAERAADQALLGLPDAHFDQLVQYVLDRERTGGVALLAKHKGPRNTRCLKLLMFERLRAGWTADRDLLPKGGK